MPSGDSPDGMRATVRANADGLFPKLLAGVPVGGSPTGAGESPALPIFAFTAPNFFQEVLEALRRAVRAGRTTDEDVQAWLNVLDSYHIQPIEINLRDVADR